MPLSSSNVSTLQKIAELAGAPEPADERLRHVLAAAREALALDALLVVVCNGASEDVQVWHSTNGKAPVDSSLVERVGSGCRKDGRGAILVRWTGLHSHPPGQRLPRRDCRPGNAMRGI